MACAAAFAGSVLQAAARFSGATGYQIVRDGTAVTLEAASIENSGGENATGTLMLKLWALESPHTGGTLNGLLLGSCKLEGLGPGRRYTGFKRTVSLAAPAVRRNYAICLTLSEFRGGAYGIVDYRNMPRPQMLGPLKMFELEGPWRWQTSLQGGTLDIAVAKIRHRRQGRTGSLRLSVWATRQPYGGGTLRGHELGFVVKKALEPGYSYTDLHHVARYTPPPAGTYFIHLVLSEFGNDQKYSIVDHLAGSKPATFAAPKP